jgi:DNA replication and repair protein RecF
LDAIYYLAFTKSFFSGNDQQHIQQGEADYFFVEADIVKNDLQEKVSVAYQRGAKKLVKVNNNEHKKLNEHIGLYPLVMIAPNDILLILEGSEGRRKFLDGFISQYDKQYLHDVLAYNRIIDQRNKHLKLVAEHGQIDPTLLQTYNEQLIKYGTAIYLKRSDFMQQFIPVFQSFYTTISEGNETVNIEYITDLHQHSFTDLLLQTERNDIMAQRTTKGIHKDELEFTIGGQSLKRFGSQGQQKSFIIALKLAQYDYLKHKTLLKPLLLLDDIFEKLDATRLNTLLGMIAHKDFGQLFITDTHLERLQQVLTNMPLVDVKYFNVVNGTIHEI